MNANKLTKKNSINTTDLDNVSGTFIKKEMAKVDDSNYNEFMTEIKKEVKNDIKLIDSVKKSVKIKNLGDLQEFKKKIEEQPKSEKELIKENHIIVRNLVVFYYNDFTLRIPYYNSPDEILNSMEFIKIKSNENKEKFIKFNKILFEWLKTTDFFSNIYNNFYNIINPDDIKSINFNNNIKLRDNQIEAFKKLDNNGLETGIHCQATGCGKSYIIIKYIHYTNKIINNPKIILFTERVNILSDLFIL